MKRTAICMAALLVALSVLLAGCSERTPLGANDFGTAATEAGFLVLDAKEQFPEGAVLDYLVAVRLDDEGGFLYQVEFASLPSEGQAVAAFNENRNNAERGKGASFTESSRSASNYSYYKLTSGGTYYVASRIGATSVYLVAPSDLKTDIDTFLEQIGY